MKSTSRILVDSNAYFRLAQSIHPLLGTVFGDKQYCLYIIKELQREYDRSPRLKMSFSWVNDPEYVSNRSHVLKVNREDRREISRAFDFIYDYARRVHPGVSRVDVICLSHAEYLGIPVVTDDEDMRFVAEYYAIKICKTLELLRLMLDCGHIDVAKVREIGAYWEYCKDKPKDFATDFKRLFGEIPLFK